MMYSTKHLLGTWLVLILFQSSQGQITTTEIDSTTEQSTASPPPSLVQSFITDGNLTLSTITSPPGATIDGNLTLTVASVSVLDGNAVSIFVKIMVDSERLILFSSSRIATWLEIPSNLNDTLESKINVSTPQENGYLINITLLPDDISDTIDNGTLVINFKVNVEDSAEPGVSLVRFNASHDSGVVTGTKYVNVLAADLEVTSLLDWSATKRQSGDVITLTETIQHSSTSSDNATNVKVQVSSSYVTIINASLTGNDPFSYNFDSTQVTLHLPLLQTTIWTLVITARLLDSIPIDSTFPVMLQVTYNSQDGPQGAAFERSISSTEIVHTKNAIIDSAQSSLGLGSTVNIGQLVTSKVKFSVPAGTMENVVLKFDVTNTGFNPADFSFQSAQVTASDVLVFPSLRRRRRSIVSRAGSFTYGPGPNLTNVTIGNIVYPSANYTTDVDVTIEVTYVISSSASITPGTASLTVSVELLTGGVSLLSLGPQTVAITVRPTLTINKTIEYFDANSSPQVLRTNVTVENGLNSGIAYDVYIYDGASGFAIDILNGLVPHWGSSGLITESSGGLRLKFTQINPGETKLLSYRSQVIDVSKVSEGDNLYNASVYYYSGPPSNVPAPAYYGPTKATTCIKRTSVEQSTLILQHGFTALTFFCAVIVGILLITLACIIWMVVKKPNLSTSVRPASAADKRKLFGKGNMLIVDSKQAMKKGKNPIMDYSTVKADESIVYILALKDKLQTFRELDGWDILSTISIDYNIEHQRINDMVQSIILLITGLRLNNDFDKATEDKCVNKFKKDITALDKRLEDDLQKEIEKCYRRLSDKNKTKLSELMNKHRRERNALEKRVMNLPEKEQGEVLALTDKEHETDQDELTYRLKLEQDEASETLRKEFAIKKRMGVKDLQQQLLKDMIEQGRLDEAKADWLIKEHHRNQVALEKIYDDEISRQRMVLEEKLARRRALAEMKENQEDNESETLNTMAVQQNKIIDKAFKQNLLDENEVDSIKEEIKKQLLEAKQRFDDEKTKQETDLHKRLSGMKKKKLEEQQKQHATELSNFEKQHKAQQTDGATDPMDYVERKAALVSGQRNELSELENKIDEEHAKELDNLHVTLVQETKTNIKENEKKLLEKMKVQGMQNDEMNRILRKHDEELEKLEGAQEQDKEQQMENFKMRLAKNRREWARRREQEKEEQEAVRQHQEAVVNNLIDNQVTLSEEERDRIMAEHEKQLVTLENSLTLNKLQQKRKLEEKLAEKRARQLEALQVKQLKEEKKKKVVLEDNEDKAVALLKKHAEQRMAVLSGEKLKLENELDTIRDEMVKERASALKEQEERIGAMMATLQMEKARELAKIEEQQKAIFNLKSNLMDDLNDRGVLSDPQCQEVIKKHQQQQNKLNKKLDAQRAQQEGMLKQRLQLRLQQRENTLLQMHEEQVKVAIEGASNKTAARIKRVYMMHTQMLEQEHARNRMEKEMNQAIEDMRVSSEKRKMKQLQEQELQFIAGLIRLGKFDKAELMNVLRLLFPVKTEKDLNAIFEQIYDKNQQAGKQDQQDMLNASSASTLGDRIRASTYGTSMPPASKKKSKRAKSAKKMSVDYDASWDAFQSKPPLQPIKYSKRPDPIGRSEPDAYNSEEEDTDEELSKMRPNSRANRMLRPISVQGRRKKKNRRADDLDYVD